MDLTALRDVRRPRRVVGAVLYGVLLLIGLALLVWLFSAPLAVKAHCDVSQYGAYMTLGALFALPAVAAYLLVPVVVDRYDPEPWWALAFAFAWGAFVATGFSGFINSGIGWVVQGELNARGQAFAEAVVSAPIVEEFWKGALVFGIFVVLRDEFDGVVDGVIYATFVALGFACVENILYYGRAGWTQLNRTNCDQHAAYEAVVTTFVVRGILSPWGHPLYTAMTGIGFGIARETNRTWLKVIAPVFGYGVAVALHAIWNGSALLSQVLAIPVITITLVLYLLFVALFSVVMIVLVAREGQILRSQLRDEVLLGTLTAEELAIVGSPIGRVRAMFKWGFRKGPRFVRAAATLGMKKWHTVRATKGRRLTWSADFIVPLRVEIFEIRRSLGLPPAGSGGQAYAMGPIAPPHGAPPYPAPAAPYPPPPYAPQGAPPWGIAGHAAHPIGDPSLARGPRRPPATIPMEVPLASPRPHVQVGKVAPAAPPGPTGGRTPPRR